MTYEKFVSGLPIPVVRQSVRAEATDRTWGLGPLVKLLGAILTCTCRCPAESPSLSRIGFGADQKTGTGLGAGLWYVPYFLQSGCRKIANKDSILVWSQRGMVFSRNP